MVWSFTSRFLVLPLASSMLLLNVALANDHSSDSSSHCLELMDTEEVEKDVTPTNPASGKGSHSKEGRTAASKAKAKENALANAVEEQCKKDGPPREGCTFKGVKDADASAPQGSWDCKKTLRPATWTCSNDKIDIKGGKCLWDCPTTKTLCIADDVCVVFDEDGNINYEYTEICMSDPVVPEAVSDSSAGTSDNRIVTTYNEDGSIDMHIERYMVGQKYERVTIGDVTPHEEESTHEEVEVSTQYPAAGLSQLQSLLE